MSSLLTINSNLSSLRVQRQLTRNTSALEQTFQRLSSGLRINRASDDAAGLAIATGLRTDSRVFAQAIRNVNDALSLYAIAEGAASELSGVLVRLSELAEQSSNGVLSKRQRVALNAEAQALRNEYNRIVDSTEFNGLSLLNQTLSTLDVQAGYDAVHLPGSGITTSMVNDGTFDAPLMNSSGGGSAPRSVAAADVNNDGILDLISGNQGTSSLSVFIGNGDATFKSGTVFTALAGTREVRTADFNRDGQTDIIYSGSSVFGVMLGNGNGTFTAYRSYQGPAGSFAPRPRIADLNGDGILDFVADQGTAAAGDTLGVYFGNGDGSFRARVSYIVGDDVSNLQLADYNEDGVDDALSLDYTAGTITFLAGNSNGSFRAPANTNTVVASLSHLDTRDLNGDGHLDVAVSGDGTSNVRVLLGNGNGTFRAGVVYTGSAPDDAVTIADLNGDAVADLSLASSTTGAISLLYGNGDGSFRASISYYGGSAIRALTVADLDKDGAFEIITPALGDNAVGVLLGNSQASYRLYSFSLATQDDSLNALDFVRGAIASVAASTGVIGSSTSRLRTTLANLQQGRENFESAATQIFDADIAEESSRLVRSQILQQASAAILAQANQQAAIVLSLL